LEFLGDEKFIGPIRDIIDTVCPPLVEISNSANPPIVLSAIFKLIRELIAVGETPDLDVMKRAEGYHQALCRFEDVLLPTFQAIISADSGLLSSMVMWATDFFDARKKMEVDLIKMIEPLKEQDKLLISAEVDSWMNYKKKEKQMRDTFQPTSSLRFPQQTVIPKLLVDPFLKWLTPLLNERIQTVEK